MRQLHVTACALPRCAPPPCCRGTVLLGYEQANKYQVRAWVPLQSCFFAQPHAALSAAAWQKKT